MRWAELSVVSVVCLFLLIDHAHTQDLPNGCYESNYTSTYTRCDMTFLICFNYVKLKQCVLRKCQRYIRAGDCRLQTSFVQEESDCYQRCCGANQFNENQCTNFNQNAQQKQNKSIVGLAVSNYWFSLALSLVASALVAFTVYFSIRKLRCCDKSDPFMLLKYNIKWRKTNFEDIKCEICKTYGSMMVTPCQHHFHISCFEENSKDMICPKCDQIIKKRIRIFCFHCRERSFKVKINKVTEISEAITQEGLCTLTNVQDRQEVHSKCQKDELFLYNDNFFIKYKWDHCSADILLTIERMNLFF